MLKERIITALLLLSTLLLIVFFTNPLFFQIFLSIATLLAVWEWTRLSGFKNTSTRVLYCIGFIFLSALSYSKLQDYLNIILGISLVFWALALLMISTYPRYNAYWNNSYCLGLMGILVLLPTWFLLIHLRSQTDFALNFISLIALVAAADTGAYFSGKSLGKHKLAKLVSPNKTWEGVAGGIISCFILVIIIDAFSGFTQIKTNNWVALLSLAFLVSFFSVVGDLFESMLKRVRGLKDSGNILPGHGGILDRIDGIVSTTPAYILMLSYYI